MATEAIPTPRGRSGAVVLNKVEAFDVDVAIRKIQTERVDLAVQEVQAIIKRRDKAIAAEKAAHLAMGEIQAITEKRDEEIAAEKAAQGAAREEVRLMQAQRREHPIARLRQLEKATQRSFSNGTCIVS